MKKYVVEDPEPIADYVLFITDEDYSNRVEAKEKLIRNSKAPVFWKFVDIGGVRFAFLQRLNEMSGRLLKNEFFSNFFY